MVVVVEQARDDRRKAVLRGAVVEAVPEDRFRLFGSQGGKPIATPRGDEIDLVVDVPVLGGARALVGEVLGVGAATDEF